MEATITTPVGIIQQLIAIHTTRKEAVDKLKTTQVGEETGTKFLSAATQSDRFISELMNELSNYGDAVSAAVDRENQYQQIWNNALGQVDTSSAQQAEQLFASLEASMKSMYEDILKTQLDLPASLAEMLNAQLKQL